MIIGRNHAPLITFVFALTIYLVTLPPGMTWAHQGSDGGDLITAAMTWGVPHPSGYPLYSVVGRLFALFPFGSVAYRFNLFSAVSMSLAAALLTHITRNRNTTASPAIAAGLTFAFAPLVWSQATITEVYGFNTLMLSLVLWATLTRQNAALIGLLCGLSVTTHLTSLLMAPFVMWHVNRRSWWRVALGGIVGVSPFLFVAIFARSSSPVVWGDATTIKGWWWVVSGVIYRPNVFSHPPLPRLTQAILPALKQFSYIGWLAFVVPIPALKGGADMVALIKGRGDMGLIASILLYGVYALLYDTPDAAVFALPALLLCAVFLTNGLRKVGKWSLVLPLIAVALNFNALNQHGNHEVEQQVTAAWENIPTDAIVLTPGDQTIFTLWYYQHVEGARQDVILVDSNLFAFEWYRERLARLYPELNGVAVDDVARFRVVNFRPICDLTLNTPDTISCTIPSE